MTDALASTGLQFDAATMRARSAAALQVSFTNSVVAPGPCQPATTGGYLGAENQLIRVMVTDANPSGVPSIVWGFDDASFLYRINTATFDPASGNTTLTLASAPVDSYHYPVAGQAVEVLRDAAQLTATSPVQLEGTDFIAAAAGIVAPVTSPYDPTQMQLAISGALPADYLSAATPQLYLRVWQAEAPAPPGQPVSLIAVNQAGRPPTPAWPSRSRPAPAPSTSGDFWRFALRPIQPAIVYPARYLTGPQPPDGPRTWACPLAVLDWSAGSATATELRPTVLRPTVESPAERRLLHGERRPVGCRRRGLAASRCSTSYADPGADHRLPGAGHLHAPGDRSCSGRELDGITLQACREGVVLQAQRPGDRVHPRAHRDAGRQLRHDPGHRADLPLAGFSPLRRVLRQPAAGRTRSCSSAFSTSSRSRSASPWPVPPASSIADCTFSLPDPGQGKLFGAGIFATGTMDGTKVTGCTFAAPARPPTVP